MGDGGRLEEQKVGWGGSADVAAANSDLKKWKKCDKLNLKTQQKMFYNAL